MTSTKNIPVLDKQPKPCNVCDMMTTLGLASAVCESLENPADKSKCQRLIKPLEDNKMKAVDALADVIVEMGDDNLNEVLDRMNLLIYSATEKAKERMIATGKLNPDGTPKVK